MKDIRVMFKGNKSPSGKKPHTEYWIGKKYLENLQADGRFDIEVLEKPIPKPKVAPKPKKKSKKESE